MMGKLVGKAKVAPISLPGHRLREKNISRSFVPMVFFRELRKKGFTTRGIGEMRPFLYWTLLWLLPRKLKVPRMVGIGH